jgi:hypothetical protein
MEKATEVIYTSKPALLPNPSRRKIKFIRVTPPSLRPLDLLDFVFDSWKCPPNSADYSHRLGANIRKDVSQQGHVSRESRSDIPIVCYIKISAVEQ